MGTKVRVGGGTAPAGAANEAARRATAAIDARRTITWWAGARKGAAWRISRLLLRVDIVRDPTDPLCLPPNPPERSRPPITPVPAEGSDLGPRRTPGRARRTPPGGRHGPRCRTAGRTSGDPSRRLPSPARGGRPAAPRRASRRRRPRG